MKVWLTEVSMYNVNEKDWKLYKKILPEWQEAYMDKLLEEYKVILNTQAHPSEKFWTLDKRIHDDKRKCGVIVKRMSRSTMEETILTLIHEGAITTEDINEFSEEFKKNINEILSLSNFSRRKI